MERPPKKESGTTSATPSIAEDAPVGFSIFRLARAHRALVAGMLRKMGLYPGQEILLMHLIDHDGLDQTELVRRIGFDASTATKMLQRLEYEGLVARRRSAQDRRAMTVHLTAKGKKLRTPLTDMWKEVERRCAASLSESQAKAVIRTMECIAKSIAEED